MKKMLLFLFAGVFFPAACVVSFFAIINYRSHAVFGVARNEQEFHAKLDAENLRPIIGLPNGATNVSYFVQPRMNGMFIKCSADNAQVRSWVDINRIVSSRIAGAIQMSWIEPQVNGGKVLVVSNGVIGEVELIDSKFMFDEDSQTFYLWSSGIHH